MKIGIQVKNNKRIIKPMKNDVIIYDGKEWYVTTKAELFKEYDERFAAKIKECDQKIKEMNARELEVAEQILKLEEIVSNLVSKGE